MSYAPYCPPGLGYSGGMSRTPLLIALVAILVLSVGGAQAVPDDDAPAPPPRVSPEQVVPARKDYVLTDRVLFVVDRSVSMNKTKLRQAVDSCLFTMFAGDDGFRVGIIGFAHTYDRWGGVPSCVPHPTRKSGDLALKKLFVSQCTKRCVPYGWAAMPTSYTEALAWLTGLVSAGATTPAPALLAALTDRTQNLTVVFVSDGEDFNGKACLKAIKQAKAWRKKRGLTEAGVMVWGAGSKARTRASLRRIAKAGGGGLWVHGKERTGPW